jgi:hypothetical protein
LKTDPSRIESFSKAAKLARAFRPVCEAHVVQEYRCVSVSWQLLLWHCEFCALYADSMKYRTMKDMDNALSCREQLVNYVMSNEQEVQSYFDAFHFVLLTRRLFQYERRLDV